LDYRLRQDAEQKLAAEQGTIYKPRAGKTSVVLVYPNTYYVGMSNLGLQTIYAYLNVREDVCCERAFLPDRELLPLYTRTGTPICSLESQTPIQEFEIVAFSVSFENDYLNLLYILELSGIPLNADERTDDDPLVLLGGAVTTINPEPLAQCIDLCVIGDGELLLDKLIDTFQQRRVHNRRQAFLEQAATIPGVYVPSCYAVEYDGHGQITHLTPQTATTPPIIAQAVFSDLEQFPTYSRILTEYTEFGGLFLLQLNRGCPYRCRFCHTGYSQPHLRHLPREIVIDLVERGLRIRDRIGLVGAAVAEYPDLQDVCEAILARGGTLSVSSLRLSAIAKHDALVRTLIKAGQKTLTAAPEAGTERLRKLVRKALPDRILFEALDAMAEMPIHNLKLYFLIGLPTETLEDLDALVDVCIRCHSMLSRPTVPRRIPVKITVSINPFVPKPFTPLQWCAMEPEAVLKRKIQYVTRKLRRLHHLEVIYEAPKWAVWQGILARGDRRVGDVLLKALEYKGDWKKAFRTLQMQPEMYVHRTREESEILPWQHVHVGRAAGELWAEYQQSVNGE